jgi:hypothetical protein
MSSKISGIDALKLVLEGKVVRHQSFIEDYIVINSPVGYKAILICWYNKPHIPIRPEQLNSLIP